MTRSRPAAAQGNGVLAMMPSGDVTGHPGPAISAGLADPDGRRAGSAAVDDAGRSERSCRGASGLGGAGWSRPRAAAPEGGRLVDLASDLCRPSADRAQAAMDGSRRGALRPFTCSASPRLGVQDGHAQARRPLHPEQARAPVTPAGIRAEDYRRKAGSHAMPACPTARQAICRSCSAASSSWKLGIRAVGAILRPVSTATCGALPCRWATSTARMTS